MLVARGVTVRLGDAPVLAGVDLTARAGEVVGVLGPNGSGKTTLLRVLQGALRPDAGTSTLDGADVARLRPRERARRVAVVGQDAPPVVPMPVRDLVLLGRSPHRADWQGWSRADHAAVDAALDRVGATPLARRPFTRLSGGERQRVLLARALAQDTDHLLLDEPTNHLDLRYQHEILGLVSRLGHAVVVVLHDVNLAARYCDRVVLLDGGVVVRSGTPATVCTPDVVRTVYGMDAVRADDGPVPQLVFRGPAGSAPPVAVGQRPREQLGEVEHRRP